MKTTEKIAQLENMVKELQLTIQELKEIVKEEEALEIKEDRDISDLNINNQIKKGNIVKVNYFIDRDIFDGEINLLHDKISDKYYNHYLVYGGKEEFEEIINKDVMNIDKSYNIFKLKKLELIKNNCISKKVNKCNYYIKDTQRYI